MCIQLKLVSDSICQIPILSLLPVELPSWFGFSGASSPLACVCVCVFQAHERAMTAAAARHRADADAAAATAAAAAASAAAAKEAERERAETTKALAAVAFTRRDKEVRARVFNRETSAVLASSFLH